MTDVAWVWAWSIGLAAVAALALEAGLRVLAKRKAARIPGPDDSEIVTLRKLARRGLGIELPRVEFEWDGATPTGFILKGPEDDGGMWVAPEIRYRWNKNADVEDSQRKELGDALRSGDPARLAEVLERLEQADVLDIHWRKQGAFEGPRMLEGATTPKSAGYLVNEGF